MFLYNIFSKTIIQWECVENDKPIYSSTEIAQVSRLLPFVSATDAKKWQDFLMTRTLSYANSR